MLRFQKSHSFVLFIILSTSLVFLTWFFIQAPAVSSQSGISIDIWISGSPFQEEGNFVPSTDLDPSFVQELTILNLSANVTAFSANEFPAAFSEAVDANEIPEIIAANNFGPLDSVLTEHVDIEDQFHFVVESLKGLASFSYLLKNSDDYEAAVNLVLREPKCATNMETQLNGIDDRRPLKTIALSTSQTYFSGAFAQLEQALSQDSIQRGTRYAEPAQTEIVVLCSIWGNRQLAFASTITSFQSSSLIGHDRLLVILKKENDEWKVLTATGDAVANREHDESISNLYAQLSSGDEISQFPEPAILLAPENGVYPEPADDERFGDFSFSPSPSSNVIYEIAEFDYENRTRLFFFDRGQMGSRPIEQLISAGKLLTTNNTWIWRVWSISSAGLIAFSESRSFDH